MYQKLILSSSLILFIGCAEISNVIDTYSNPKPHKYNSIEVSNLSRTINIINSKNKDKLLKNAELGLAYYFHGDHKKSNAYLDNAITQYRQYENRAILSLRSSLYQEYQGEKYDKVFMHNYKALNYLMMGEAEKSQSECKNSNHFQNVAYLSFEKFKREYTKQLDNTLAPYYAKIFSPIDPQHHPFKNPFAFYIEALAYYENGNFPNAIRALRTAQRYAPNAIFLEKKLHEYQSRKKVTRIELFFDVGHSPLKEQFSLELPMENGNVRQAYFPAFEIRKSDVAYIKIVDSKGIEIARTSLLTDVNAIKINEFKEKVPHLVYMPIKQTALSGTSMVLKPYPIARAGFNIITTLSSQYSKLTWSLLPQKILVSSFIPKKSENYKLIVFSENGEVLDSANIHTPIKRNTKNIYQHFTIRDEKIIKE